MHLGPLTQAQEEYYLDERNNVQLVSDDSAAGNYLAGHFAQKNNDWIEASRYLGNVLKITPENIELQKRAMVLSMGAGDIQTALTHAKALDEKGEGEVLSKLFLSIDEIKKKDNEKALSYIDALPSGGVAEFVQPLIRAWLDPTNKERLDVLAKGNSIHQFHAFLIMDYLGKDLNNLLDTIDIESFEKEGMSVYSLEKIADIYARFKKKEKALTLYKRLQAFMPENQSLTEKIKGLEKDGHIAITQTHPLIKTPEEGVAKALFDIATLIYQDLSDDSSRLFSYLALYLDPSLKDAHYLLAHIETSYKRYDEAIAHYRAAAMDGAELQIAALLEESERYDAAIETLQNYVAQENSIPAQIQIGDLYRRTEALQDSLKAYNKAADMIQAETGKTDIPAKYWSLLYSRGMIYEQLKQWDKAEADLKQALSYEPDHPYILNYLGYSWADQGIHLDKALEMIEKAHKLRPEDGYIADSLGWVYYQMGRYKDAVVPMEKAVHFLSYDPTINDHLGNVYWRLGRHTEARFQWNRAINYTEDEELSKTIKEKLRRGLTGTPEKVTVSDTK